MNLLLHPKTASELQRVGAKPPQALLVVAPTGAGKHTLARQLAADVLGVAPHKLSNSGALLELVADSDQSLGIDSIRQAQHFMTRKTARQSKEIHRVVLLLNAHQMTVEAQNALLKLLEEPPADSMLMLTSASQQSLLPTILSRCRVLVLHKPEPADLTKNLTDRGYSAEAVSLALRLSDGWPGLALSVLDPAVEHPLKQATEQARQLLQQTSFERLSQVDALAKKRDLCDDTCYILQQMAHLALRTAQPEAIDRWQRVLTAAYQCQTALQARANAKLALTQLMLAL